MSIDISKLTLEEILELKAQLARVKYNGILTNGQNNPSENDPNVEAAKNWDWSKNSMLLSIENKIPYVKVLKYRKLLGKPKSTKLSRLDTSGWDWGKTNSQLGREKMMNVNTIRKLRILNNAPASNKRETFMPPEQKGILVENHRYNLSAYEGINWERRDIDIARELNVTRERIRQIRIRLGKPKFLPSHERFKKFSEAFKDTEAVAYNGANAVIPMSYYQFKACLRRTGKKNSTPRERHSKWPWHLVNFDLPNAVLSWVWKIPNRGVLANERCNHIRPKAAFHCVKGKYPPEFTAIVEAEQKKADEYFKSLHGAQAMDNTLTSGSSSPPQPLTTTP